MNAIVYFSVRVDVSIPDDWCDRCRKMQEEMGENYIGADWDDKQIITYLAEKRGIEHIQWLEAVGEEMSNEVFAEITDMDVDDSELWYLK